MREIQIKSDKKGTQVALSSKRKITRARNVYTHYTHVGKNCGSSSSSTGLTWLNYHPNFMNILKWFARTMNTCDRLEYVCVILCVSSISKNIIIFSNVVGLFSFTVARLIQIKRSFR